MPFSFYIQNLLGYLLGKHMRFVYAWLLCLSFSYASNNAPGIFSNISSSDEEDNEQTSLVLIGYHHQEQSINRTTDKLSYGPVQQHIDESRSISNESQTYVGHAPQITAYHGLDVRTKSPKDYTPLPRSTQVGFDNVKTLADRIRRDSHTDTDKSETELNTIRKDQKPLHLLDDPSILGLGFRSPIPTVPLNNKKPPFYNEKSIKSLNHFPELNPYNQSYKVQSKKVATQKDKKTHEEPHSPFGGDNPLLSPPPPLEEEITSSDLPKQQVDCLKRNSMSLAPSHHSDSEETKDRKDDIVPKSTFFVSSHVLSDIEPQGDSEKDDLKEKKRPIEKEQTLQPKEWKKLREDYQKQIYQWQATYLFFQEVEKSTLKTSETIQWKPKEMPSPTQEEVQNMAKRYLGLLAPTTQEKVSSEQTLEKSKLLDKWHDLVDLEIKTINNSYFPSKPIPTLWAAVQEKTIEGNMEPRIETFSRSCGTSNEQEMAYSPKLNERSFMPTYLLPFSAYEREKSHGWGLLVLGCLMGGGIILLMQNGLPYLLDYINHPKRTLQPKSFVRLPLTSGMNKKQD